MHGVKLRGDVGGAVSLDNLSPFSKFCFDAFFCAILSAPSSLKLSGKKFSAIPKWIAKCSANRFGWGGRRLFERGMQQKCNFKEGFFKQTAKNGGGIKPKLFVFYNFANN